MMSAAAEERGSISEKDGGGRRQGFGQICYGEGDVSTSLDMTLRGYSTWYDGEGR